MKLNHCMQYCMTIDKHAQKSRMVHINGIITDINEYVLYYENKYKFYLLFILPVKYITSKDDLNFLQHFSNQ